MTAAAVCGNCGAHLPPGPVAIPEWHRCTDILDLRRELERLKGTTPRVPTETCDAQDKPSPRDPKGEGEWLQDILAEHHRAGHDPSAQNRHARSAYESDRVFEADHDERMRAEGRAEMREAAAQYVQGNRPDPSLMNPSTLAREIRALEPDGFVVLDQDEAKALVNAAIAHLNELATGEVLRAELRSVLKRVQDRMGR